MSDLHEVIIRIRDHALKFEHSDDTAKGFALATIAGMCDEAIKAGKADFILELECCCCRDTTEIHFADEVSRDIVSDREEQYVDGYLCAECEAEEGE
jgi:hypothetical protein